MTLSRRNWFEFKFQRRDEQNFEGADQHFENDQQAVIYKIMLQ